jgi:type I restriction enzyme M protein
MKLWRLRIVSSDYENYFLDCIDFIEDSVDKTDLREVLTPLIFYKSVCDTFEDNFQSAMEDVEDDDLARDKAFHTIVVPEDYEWDSFMQEVDNLDKFVDEALHEIKRENEELEDLFSADMISSEVTSEDLARLREHLDKRSLSVINNENRVLYSGFKKLIKEFARKEDRDPGELYQPQGIIDILIGVLEPFEPGSEIHDPVAGSGDILIDVFSHYRDIQEEDTKDIDISGQESIKGGLELVTTNFFLNRMHNIADIRPGDPIKNPEFTEDSSVKEFDYILCNFPFGKDWDKEREGFGRFDWSERLPAKDKADYAYIMHMFDSLRDSGKMAVVVPKGVLFRDKEEKFRTPMIENDWVEAVIGLPEKLFGEDTDIAPAILVLNKEKPGLRENEVFFFHANEEEFYDELDDVNKITEEGIESILDSYEEREDREKISKVVSKKKIEENGYSLHISLYINTAEPEEDIDTISESEKLISLEEELEEIKERKDSHLRNIYGERYKEVEKKIRGEE